MKISLYTYKTYVFAVLLSLMFIFSNDEIFSQIHIWPPNGIKPAASFSKVDLPNSRFIPSTKRWNLVWADQIIPSGLSAQKIEFAAKNYIGTQKLFPSQCDIFRNYNPNFLVLMYHLALGLNPETNNDCPNPKDNSGESYIGVVSPKGFVSEWLEYFMPWVTNRKLTAQGIEDMFQHFDVSDSAHRVWHRDPYWLMNASNPDWDEYVAAICLDWMYEVNDGCFFDVAVESSVSLYNPNSSNPAPGNFNWWENPRKLPNALSVLNDRGEFAVWMNGLYLQYFQGLYKYFHTAETSEYLIIPNVDQMITTVYDPYWLDGNAISETVDGAMTENFGNATGSDMYQSLDRIFRHLTKRNKIWLAQFSASTSAERLRRTAMYMLLKNDVSFINIVNGGNVKWYPEYETDLGNFSPLPDSLSDMVVKGTGTNVLLRRSYDSGMVVCNTSDQPISYNPYGEGWGYLETAGGGSISDDGSLASQTSGYIPFKGSIDVQPYQCLIIKKIDTTDAVNDLILKKDDPEIFPNPVENVMNLRFNNTSPGYETIKIVNVLGEQVADLSGYYYNYGENIVRLDCQAYPKGVYYVKLNDRIISFVKI